MKQNSHCNSRFFVKCRIKIEKRSKKYTRVRRQPNKAIAEFKEKFCSQRPFFFAKIRLISFYTENIKFFVLWEQIELLGLAFSVDCSIPLHEIFRDLEFL